MDPPTDFGYLLDTVPPPLSSSLPLPSNPAPPPPQQQPPPSQPATTTPVATETPPPNPKKRPLEDKKAREKKRILRNRELARVSNERRKGRIKAMENELNETRQTVATLEESIRCLEAENKELRNLLTSKPSAVADASAAGPASDPGVVPPATAGLSVLDPTALGAAASLTGVDTPSVGGSAGAPPPQ